MPLVPAAFPQGPAARRQGETARSRLERTCARGSLLMWRAPAQTRFAGRAIGGARRRRARPWRVRPCNFLFFRCRASRPTRCAKRRAAAALHKSIVSINENTMTGFAVASAALIGTVWISYRKRPAPAACTAIRTMGDQSDISRRTMANNTGRNPGAPPEWTRGRAASATPANRRPPSARPGPRPGDRAPSSRIVNPCRSLLIPRFRAPGGTWGRRRARHGQRPPRRPPSRFTESGGRP